MSILSRIANAFRADKVSGEIEEEFEAHVAEGVAQGRDSREARRALGAALQARERSRDLRVLPWLDSLRADAVFGWRQLMKRKATTAAAVASLGLAIGACTAAYRLIDALLLRNLPIAHPERLYGLSRQVQGSDGKPATYDSFAYPDFQLMRAAAASQAELLAFSYLERVDLTYKSAQEMEKAHLQYVSGAMFQTFGLRPVVGRLLTAEDDAKPGAHPYAVLSRDYWMRRFAGDPAAVGRTFHLGTVNIFADADVEAATYQIVGVIDGPFTGTEPGQVTDVFLPTMMHPGVTKSDWTWARILASVSPGAAIEPLRARLDATSRAFEFERSKQMTTIGEKDLARFLNQKMLLGAAPGGVSNLQETYRTALTALAALAALALLIACVNVANLKAAQAAARTREIALRVSIGAGRWRLAQLVLAESAWLALLAAVAGLACAAWATPFLVGMIQPPSDPARLALPVDWRLSAFVGALALAAACLFGLTPALRAGLVKPAAALKGGDDPHSRRRGMRALVAAQVAFCFVALFVAGLFLTTFDRLSHRPLGFAPDRLVTLETVAERAEAPVFWDQAVDRLRAMPGVESASASSWALLSGGSWNGFVSVNGAPTGHDLAYFLRVSPGWFETMRIPLIAGREFRPGDTYPGAAIVNETFARQYFGRNNPIGQTIDKDDGAPCVIVGVARDAPYRDVREGVLPVAFVPFHAVDRKGAESPVRTATFLVRTASADPTAMESALRAAVPQARPEFRVSEARTVAEVIRAQTTRERLLAVLAAFFGAVALLLAGIGLYGVLDYSVLQRRREIGIRMAIGAQAGDVAWQVGAEALTMLVAGAAAGIALGLGAARYVESLLYSVKATDAGMLVLPAAAMLAAVALASLPAVWRAVKIDPVRALRVE